MCSIVLKNDKQKVLTGELFTFSTEITSFGPSCKTKELENDFWQGSWSEEKNDHFTKKCQTNVLFFRIDMTNKTAEFRFPTHFPFDGAKF